MTKEEQRATFPDAMKDIVKILEPMEAGDRQKVLAAVHVYFELSVKQGSQPSLPSVGGSKLDGVEVETPPEAPVGLKDIRTLKEEKQPKTAIEMAALMAYYLKELAPIGERKDSVSAADVKNYFLQAQFKLPASDKQTLINAKNAGFFESAGEGEFKLNPVGYNLVIHSLPRTISNEGRKTKRRKSGARQTKKRKERRVTAGGKKKGKR